MLIYFVFGLILQNCMKFLVHLNKKSSKQQGKCTILAWFQWEHAAHTAACMFQCVFVAWLSGGFLAGTVLCLVLHRELQKITQLVLQSWRCLLQTTSARRWKGTQLFCSGSSRSKINTQRLKLCGENINRSQVASLTGLIAVERQYTWLYSGTGGPNVNWLWPICCCMVGLDLVMWANLS